jgi:hypothetical protein
MEAVRNEVDFAIGLFDERAENAIGQLREWLQLAPAVPACIGDHAAVLGRKPMIVEGVEELFELASAALEDIGFGTLTIRDISGISRPSPEDQDYSESERAAISHPDFIDLWTFAAWLANCPYVYSNADDEGFTEGAIATLDGSITFGPTVCQK